MKHKVKYICILNLVQNFREWRTESPSSERHQLNRLLRYNCVITPFVEQSEQLMNSLYR